MSECVEHLKHDLKAMLVDVANLQDVKPDSILDDEILFGGRFGLDSIDLLEIVVTLEKKYGIRIKNNDQGRDAMRNVQNLAQAIASYQTEKVVS